MTTHPFSRTELLYGAEALDKLKAARVAVFGLGGVGGYAAEALARSGIGTLDIVDNDTVSLTNLNRQIIALHSTLGLLKTEAMQRRIADINPACRVHAYPLFFSEEKAEAFDFTVYDYVVDAVDSVQAKLLLAERCTEAGVPLIASMGAGNKLDPSRFEIADIAKTSYDPLARVMRTALRKKGIRHLTVVYSKEPPRKNGQGVPASNAFVPPSVGLLIASKVVNDLTGVNVCPEN